MLAATLSIPSDVVRTGLSGRLAHRTSQMLGQNDGQSTAPISHTAIVSARQYASTHPWTSFQATDINRAPPSAWVLFGEAKWKCEHLAGAPLKPAVARELYRVTLVRGASAATAIEGNTLTEEQAIGVLDGPYAAPPSRQYQEQEVRNALEALQGLSGQIARGERIKLAAQLIKDFNHQVLEDLPLDDHVEPGIIRNDSVGVGAATAAPPQRTASTFSTVWSDGSTARRSRTTTPSCASQL